MFSIYLKSGMLEFSFLSAFKNIIPLSISRASDKITGQPQLSFLWDTLFILMTFCFFEFLGLRPTRYLSHPRFFEHFVSLGWCFSSGVGDIWSSIFTKGLCCFLALVFLLDSNYTSDKVPILSQKPLMLCQFCLSFIWDLFRQG